MIAKSTFTEVIRSKVLYLVLAFAAILVVVSSAFANVTIGDPVKTIKDFGLLSISLFSVIFIAISGSVLLSKELQRKTIYNILSRPISRHEYMIGKFFGIWLSTAVLIALMTISLIGYTFLLGGGLDPQPFSSGLLHES